MSESKSQLEEWRVALFENGAGKPVIKETGLRMLSMLVPAEVREDFQAALANAAKELLEEGRGIDEITSHLLRDVQPSPGEVLPVPTTLRAMSASESITTLEEKSKSLSTELVDVKRELSGLHPNIKLPFGVLITMFVVLTGLTVFHTTLRLDAERKARQEADEAHSNALKPLISSVQDLGSRVAAIVPAGINVTGFIGKPRGTAFSFHLDHDEPFLIACSGSGRAINGIGIMPEGMKNPLSVGTVRDADYMRVTPFDPVMSVRVYVRGNSIIALKFIKESGREEVLPTAAERLLRDLASEERTLGLGEPIVGFSGYFDNELSSVAVISRKQK